MGRKGEGGAEGGGEEEGEEGEAHVRLGIQSVALFVESGVGHWTGEGVAADCALRTRVCRWTEEPREF